MTRPEGATASGRTSIQDGSRTVYTGTDFSGFMARRPPGSVVRLINRLQLHAHPFAHRKCDYGLLHDFVRRSRPWSRERVRLPRRLQATLWVSIPVQILWALWLTTIITGARPCGGPFCTVATLNHHAALLACAVINVTGLVVLIPFTRGLSQCNDRELVVVAAASAAGGVALLGIAALLTGAVIVLILLAIFILGFTAT